MKTMDGLEATRILRSQPAGAKMVIVALTAHAMPGDRARCIAAGMDDYLSKPVSSAALLDCLRRWPHCAKRAGTRASALRLAVQGRRGIHHGMSRRRAGSAVHNGPTGNEGVPGRPLSGAPNRWSSRRPQVQQTMKDDLRDLEAAGNWPSRAPASACGTSIPCPDRALPRRNGRRCLATTIVINVTSTATWRRACTRTTSSRCCSPCKRTWMAARRLWNGSRLRAADGRYRNVLSRGRVVARDASGRALRVVGTLTDLTGRRQAEQRRWTSTAPRRPAGRLWPSSGASATTCARP